MPRQRQEHCPPQQEQNGSTPACYPRLKKMPSRRAFQSCLQMLMPLAASRCFIGIGGGGRVRTSDTRPRCRRPWMSMLGQGASKE